MTMIYELTYGKLVKMALTNPLIIIVMIASFIIGAVIILALMEGLSTWRAIAMLIFILLVPVIPLLILTPSRIGYGVDDGYIVITYYKTYRVPIDGANVSLVPYQSVKPTFRVAGVALPGVALGKYKFANGKYGVAIVFHPSDKAIVISYDGKYFVISHPGVEKAYVEPMKLIREHKGVSQHGAS